MTPSATASYQLKARSVAFYRPTYQPAEMSSLNATKQDLMVLVENTKRYLSSPMCDRSERLRLEEFLEGLYEQVDEINRQLGV